MDRTPVISTNVASVGYDPGAATLEVEFKDGSIYQYFNVPQVVADQLVAASSVGGFLAANVKNRFQYTKL